MEQSRKYFTNSPWGNLFFDQAFLSYNTLPLVFSLRDAERNHYLSICISWHHDYEWLLMDVTASELLALMHDSLSIFALLTKTGKKKVHCKWPEHAESAEYNVYLEFPPELLPQEDVYLQLNLDLYKEYVFQLQDESKNHCSAYTIVHIPKIVFPVFRTQLGPVSFSMESEHCKSQRETKPFSSKRGYWFSTELQYDTKITRHPR